jgi:hypothetical protein
VRPAPALPAIKAQEYFICDDTGILALVYADPKAAGTPVDVIVIVPGKALKNYSTVRSTKDGIFIGDVLCKPAKMTLCPADQNPTATVC